MGSEGEIDTWNEITLDKLKSNLSDVGLPSDSEFIRVSYVKTGLQIFGCAIYDMCRSQLKPNSDYSSTSEYVCEIWLMK